MDTIQFENIVKPFYELLLQTNEETSSRLPSDGSWSLKQIVGHLIDSAGNFHQRLVRLQNGNLENFPTYHGEFWVKKQNFQQEDWGNICVLWYSFNLHLLHVIRNISDETLTNEWILEEGIGADLKWLIEDYYQHMQHHITKFKNKDEV